MSRKYRFSVNVIDKSNIIVVRVIGDMPSAMFVDKIFDIYKKIKKPWLYKRLLDLRKFDGIIFYDDLEHMARRWALITKGVVYSNKVAMVSHTEFELARISTIAPLFPYDILRGFSAIDLALDWLVEE